MSDRVTEINNEEVAKTEPVKPPTTLESLATQLETLEKVSDKDAPRFTFQGHKLLGKCVKVYDGDNILVKIGLAFFGICKILVRLQGYEEEVSKSVSIKERDYLEDLLLNKYIVVDCSKFDDMGRIYANIFQILDDKPLLDPSTLVDRKVAVKPSEKIIPLQNDNIKDSNPKCQH